MLTVIVVMAALNVMAALLVKGAVTAGKRVAAEQQGRIVIDQWFATRLSKAQQPVAIVGIVYLMMTAAAMWQNFRAHLPYLYDPWSERRPRRRR